MPSRVNYKSIQIRCPEPVYKEVMRIIREFREKDLKERRAAKLNETAQARLEWAKSKKEKWENEIAKIEGDKS